MIQSHIESKYEENPGRLFFSLNNFESMLGEMTWAEFPPLFWQELGTNLLTESVGGQKRTIRNRRKQFCQNASADGKVQCGRMMLSYKVFPDTAVLQSYLVPRPWITPCQISTLLWSENIFAQWRKSQSREAFSFLCNSIFTRNIWKFIKKQTQSKKRASVNLEHPYQNWNN